MIEQREAQLEQLVRRRVHPSEQHALVADVAEAHVEQLPHGVADERGHLLRGVHVGVHRDVDVALARPR